LITSKLPAVVKSKFFRGLLFAASGMMVRPITIADKCHILTNGFPPELFGFMSNTFQRKAKLAVFKYSSEYTEIGYSVI